MRRHFRSLKRFTGTTGPHRLTLHAAPLSKPLAPLEEQVLNDLYDAEVAYQDAYLAQLFETLAKRKNADNTMIVIVGDHGDGLGDHGYVGHAFNAYQELVHVLLRIVWK